MRSLRPCILRAGLVLLVGLLVLGAWPVPARAEAADPDRTLVVSLPGLTWADLADHDLPALEAFFGDAALADLAPRGVSPRSGPGDAYLTISAGSRSTTVRGVDGQVLALDETSSGSAAGEIFARRTGLTPDGDYVALTWPALMSTNADRPYDAVLGLLATTLEEEGVTASAIGNADGTDSIGVSYERQVGLAVSDEDGVVAGGTLTGDLLVDDPARPFGRRLDADKVMAGFDEAWTAPGRHLVVVEASDLARTMRYRPMVDADRYDRLWADALEEADALVARLLAATDPAHDVVLVLAPYNLPRDRDLTVVALRGPGVAPGYLRSASTQRAGFLTLVDVAPTILDRFGIARPAEMEGRPAEVTASTASLEARESHLVAMNAASRFRERLLVPTTLVVVLGVALIAAAAAVVLTRGSAARWRGPLTFAALADLSLLPASYLARGFALEDRGIGFYWAFIVLAALALAGAASLIARGTGHRRLGLVVVLSTVALVLVGDVMTGSRLSLSAAFGYSPTGNSRLYGISNYSYGQLAAAVCLLAAMVAAARPARRAHAAAIALLLAALVVLGVPKWGSDVGGVLAFTPSIAVFAMVLFGWRIRLRTILAVGLATAAAITAFGLLDLSRPPEERAHLGRLFERVGNEGLGPLIDIMQRKLLANLAVSTSSLWVAAIPIAVAFWVFLARSPTAPLARLQARTPTMRAGLAAATAAAVLGSLVNDSGAIVGGVAGLVLTAALVCLTLEADPA